MDAQQRVVVIQDASRDVSANTLGWILHGFSLRPEDLLTLLVVIHQVNTPMGYKSRVDSSSLIGVNPKIVEWEAAKKREEYANNMELIQIFNLYETHKITFKIELITGPSPKVVALKAAQDIKATWVILDRRMKKDRNYFLEKLSCGVSRMKRDNIIEQFRGPISRESAIEASRKSYLSYDEMVPGVPEERDVFSFEILVSESNHTGKDDKVSQVQNAKQISEVDKPGHDQEMKQKQISISDEIKHVWQADEIFQSTMCSICKNSRPDSGWKDFTYAELEAATDDFSPRNSLTQGEGGFAFKGKLKNGMKIVVKKQEHRISETDLNLEAEIHLLKKARHVNVVTLLGCCTEGSSMLLVYESACNGSVNQHLSQHCPLPMTWTERMRVALGAGRGLRYLHEKNIIHRRMRTSNILLIHDFEPMIGDFGLTGPMSEQSLETKVLDSLEYLAPEWLETRKFTFNTDVYAFGVVLLELISGHMTTEKLHGEKSLLEWARPLLKDRRHDEILDPRIIGAYDEQELYWMCRLTHKCLSKDPKKRYKMDRVVSALECATDRKTREVFEAISAVKSFLSRSRPTVSDHRSDERASRQEGFFTETDAKSWMVKSSSISTNAQQQQFSTK